jgi:protein-tyrosine phosphatase
MAMGLLRQRLVKEGLDSQYEVRSVGVRAVDGQGASRNAVLVMAERFVDITEHVARTITGDDVAKADLILAMSREHARMINRSWPQYAYKVHLLSEMAGKKKDVRDPYGGSMREYEASANVISDYIDQGFERIIELA